MGRKLKQNEHNASIYFRINDEDTWAMIDKLMTLPCYANSRAALLNDALAYGLPKLIDAKFGEVKLEYADEPRPQEIMTVPDERIELMIRLMQEIVMNTTISKSLICSLFNAKNKELQEQVVSPRNFECGYMLDTPNFMMKYEVDMLNAMDDDDDD